MITEQKISLYKKYNGLEDAYIFEKGDSPDDLFEANDWGLISELIGRIILLQSGNADKAFEEQLNQFVYENTENENVIRELKELAKQRIEQKRRSI